MSNASPEPRPLAAWEDVLETIAQDLVRSLDANPEPATPPAPAAPADQAGPGDVLQGLQAARAHLERLQACLDQAEKTAGVAGGQLAIEAEALENFRDELVGVREKLARWRAGAA